MSGCSGNNNCLPGIQGPVGPTGPQGPAGQNGAQGPQGPQGIQGLQGIAGNDGADGYGYNAGSVSTIDVLNTVATTAAFSINPEKAYTPGARVRVAVSTSPTSNYFEGTVTSYNANTGAMIVSNIDLKVGIGNYSSWTVNLAGEKGVSGGAGVQGPVGPQGPAGPVGPAGANGTNGTNGIDSSNVLSFLTSTGTDGGGVGDILLGNYTTTSGVLNSSGDTIVLTAGGTADGSSAGTKDIRLEFDGTVLVSNATLTVPQNRSFEIKCTVIAKTIDTWTFIASINFGGGDSSDILVQDITSATIYSDVHTFDVIMNSTIASSGRYSLLQMNAIKFSV